MELFQFECGYAVVKFAISHEYENASCLSTEAESRCAGPLWRAESFLTEGLSHAMGLLSPYGREG